MSTDNRGHIIALNPAELAMLWQLLNSASIPGQVAEIFVGLKGQVREAMEKMSEEASLPQESGGGASPGQSEPIE